MRRWRRGSPLGGVGKKTEERLLQPHSVFEANQVHDRQRADVVDDKLLKIRVDYVALLDKIAATGRIEDESTGVAELDVEGARGLLQFDLGRQFSVRFERLLQCDFLAD